MGGTQPWPQVPVGNKDHTSAAVVIIGAGISGMCMAIDLIKRNQCHNFIIVEKSSGVGGTWNDNRYPGCCCDVWSMLYSYSFEQNPDWSREYPGQEEILDYLRNIAHKYKLYKYIRFNTAVEAATWDDEASRWKVDVKVTGGKDAEFSPSYTIECDFLISAIGQLNQPRYPDIEGLEDFKGKIMHSARWDWSYDIRGKNIGIIGNGATAAQIIPEILPEAQSLTIYQRTPNWIIPRLDGPVSSLRRTIYRYLPPIRWRKRALLMDIRESFYDAVCDSAHAAAQGIRHLCSTSMQAQLPNRPDLWPKLLPTYSPGCKRVVITDDYYPALASPKTRLETRHIARITPSGITLSPGEDQKDEHGEEGEGEGEAAPHHHAHDVLILATGFRTTQFLFPIHITGTGSRTLPTIWAQGAEALYGVSVPHLPNFGMFYGPNTNLGHNSIILMIEAQSRYLNALVAAVIDARARDPAVGLALVPREDRTREFNARIQGQLQESSIADPKCASWYKDEKGKITNNWSGTVVEYQELLSRVDWEDFEAVGGEGRAGVRASQVVFGGKRETRLGRVKEESVVGDLGLGAVVSAVSVVSVLAVGAAWVFKSGRVRW